MPRVVDYHIRKTIDQDGTFSEVWVPHFEGGKYKLPARTVVTHDYRKNATKKVNVEYPAGYNAPTFAKNAKKVVNTTTAKHVQVKTIAPVKKTMQTRTPIVMDAKQQRMNALRQKLMNARK